MLFEPDPEPGAVPPVDFFIVPVLKSGMSTGPPRVIAPVWVSGSSLILYDDCGCGLMEPSDPMSLYAPARLFD